PRFHHPVPRALGGDRESVELAREAYREVADVDHLLHFAEALLQALAGLDAHEASQRGLGRAQLLAQQAHHLAAPRCGPVAPIEERLARLAPELRHLFARRHAQPAEVAAVDRRARHDVGAAPAAHVDAELVEERADVEAGGVHGIPYA